MRQALITLFVLAFTNDLSRRLRRRGMAYRRTMKKTSVILFTSALIAFMIGVLWLWEAQAQTTGYQPIPNYGAGGAVIEDQPGQAGYYMRRDINNRFSGQVQTSPQLVHLNFYQLPAIVVNGQEYYVNDATPGSLPCTPGGGGAVAIGVAGQWACVPTTNLTASNLPHITFSNLPGTVSTGQLYYINDGTPGSVPCTGGGTGTIAMGIGTQWVCYAPGTVVTSGNSLLKGNGAGGIVNAASGTDYAPATAGTFVLKGNGSGAFAAALPGTDFAPVTPGAYILKGDGAGKFAQAVQGTDYFGGEALLCSGSGTGGTTCPNGGGTYACYQTINGHNKKTVCIFTNYCNSTVTPQTCSLTANGGSACSQSAYVSSNSEPYAVVPTGNPPTDLNLPANMSNNPAVLTQEFEMGCV